MPTRRRALLILAALALLALTSLVLALMVGSVHVPLGEVFPALFGSADSILITWAGGEDVTALLLREVLVVDVAAAFVAVMTFCCGVDFNVPVCWAMARKRCTESMTACGWARKALPRFSTHGAFSPINARREGKATSDFTLGSQG